MTAADIASDNETHVHILLDRIADEIERLSEVTDRLQHTTFEVAALAGPAHLATFQELDRLHQNLTQLAVVVRNVAIAIPKHCAVETTSHTDHISVTRLLHTLLGIVGATGHTTSVSHDDLELFEPADPALRSATEAVERAA